MKKIRPLPTTKVTGILGHKYNKYSFERRCVNTANKSKKNTHTIYLRGHVACNGEFSSTQNFKKDALKCLMTCLKSRETGCSISVGNQYETHSLDNLKDLFYLATHTDIMKKFIVVTFNGDYDNMIAAKEYILKNKCIIEKKDIKTYRNH